MHESPLVRIPDPPQTAINLIVTCFNYVFKIVLKCICLIL